MLGKSNNLVLQQQKDKLFFCFAICAFICYNNTLENQKQQK